MKQIFKIILPVVIIFIVLFVLSIAIPVIIFGTPRYYFVVEGNAMSPEYNTGDKILIKKMELKDLKIESAITFSNQAGHVLFGKISSIDYDKKIFSITAGNNASLSYGKDLSSDLIIGKVIGKVPYPFSLLFDNLPIRLLIICFLTYFISLIFKKWRKIQVPI